MWDETFYENANTFDPYRFLKKRQTPGQGIHAQLVTPSAEHLGWGLGNHACPGRFFAANQMKIFLCHVLLKYNFKLADGSVPQLRRQGFALSADKSANISLHRRHEEIVLEDITD
jgi:cytochrome P450